MKSTLQDSLTVLRDQIQLPLHPAGSNIDVNQRKYVEPGFCGPDCQICAGAGYTRRDLPLDHPNFGRLQLCPNVDRWALPGAARYGITRQESLELTWDQIIDANNFPHVVDAVQQTLDRGYGWVYLFGGFGLGKTLALKIAIAEAIRAGSEAAYVRMAEILDHLRAAFADSIQETESSRLNWWSGLPVLAIDEFDRVRSTGYGEERRFVLMDRRYEQAIRRESLTLIASNTDPRRLPGYLYDRVRDGRFSVVKIEGESLRPGFIYDI
jgi:DNA replication protein DnaC